MQRRRHCVHHSLLAVPRAVLADCGAPRPTLPHQIMTTPNFQVRAPARNVTPLREPRAATAQAAPSWCACGAALSNAPIGGASSPCTPSPRACRPGPPRDDASLAACVPATQPTRAAATLQWAVPLTAPSDLWRTAPAMHLFTGRGRCPRSHADVIVTVLAQFCGILRRLSPPTGPFASSAKGAEFAAPVAANESQAESRGACALVCDLHPCV